MTQTVTTATMVTTTSTSVTSTTPSATTISTASSVTTTTMPIITTSTLVTTTTSANTSNITPSTSITTTMIVTSTTSSIGTTSTTISTETTTTTTTTKTTTTTTSTTSTATTTTTPIPCINMSWNMTGETIAGTTGTFGSADNQLSQPWNLFVDGNKNMYIADAANHRVQLWPAGATSGTTIAGITGSWCSSSNRLDMPSDVRGGASNQLNGNQGIALDTTINVGYLYIANANQHTIVNVVAGTNGIQDSDSSTMRFSVAVRIDPYRNLYIVDNNNHRIQLYCRFPTVSSTARIINGTGSSGSTPTTLRFPSGLALDNDLNIYVADNDNHRIQRFARIT